jgi:uncharacterized protein YfiM (DUF2279 family)
MRLKPQYWVNLRGIVLFVSIALMVLIIGVELKATDTSALVDTGQSTFDFSTRKQWLAYTGIGGGAAVHTGLYLAWYRGYESAPFHFHNDGKDWLQMDKWGHAYSAYYLGLMAYESSLWAGYSPTKSAHIGLIYGIAFQTMIEVFDGFSAQWGASVYDVAANTAGSLLFYLQARWWNTQKIILKYNYIPTTYASLRPELLGNGMHQSFLKDYNGQAYWMVCNPFDFFKSSPEVLKNVPISLALGYSADGMLGGTSNVWQRSNGDMADYRHIARKRTLYLSVDVDWIKLLKPQKKRHRLMLTALNAVKIPFPSLGFYMNGGVVVKPEWLR